MPPDEVVSEIQAMQAAEAARQAAIAAPQRPREAANGSAADAWLQKTFQGVVDDVKNTPKGNRNGRLRWAARRLGEISHGGLDEHTCKRALEQAAQDNGVWKDDGAYQCRASIESGWTKGVANPTDLSDIGRQTTAKIAASKPSRKTEGFEERSIKMRRLSTVKSRVPMWVWEYDGKGRIQLGTLTMFAGKPSAGKSTAVRWFAARLSKGELPGAWHGVPMRVAMIMTEEQTDAVIVPSLVAADANLDNCIQPEFRYGDQESSFMAVADEQALTQELLDTGVRALFVDPIMSTFSGKADVYRNNEVRQYLAPYTRIAEAINGIVIGVTHLTKGEVRDVLTSMNGSSAFGEVPRAVFGFAPIDGGDHVMEQVKNSAGPIGLKLAYQLPIQYLTADDGQPIELPTFEITGESEIGISDIGVEEDAVTGVAQTVKWLRAYLVAEQPVSSIQVKKVAKEQADIGERMLQRAAKRLGVLVISVSKPGKPYMTAWALPGYEEE